MKQVLVLIATLLLIVIGVCSSCGAKTTYTLDEERTNAYQNEDSNQVDEGTEFESVSKYLNYYKNYEGEIVTVPGILNDDNIEGFLDETDQYVNIKTEGFEGFDKIQRHCKVYATGTSCIDKNGDPYIDLTSIYYYETLKEPYWSNSTLVTDENILGIFSSDADPNAYYEFTAVPSANSEYIQILGLNDTPIIHNRGTEFTLPMSGDVCQILITNVTVNDDGIRFDIADYIDLETDEY